MQNNKSLKENMNESQSLNNKSRRVFLKSLPLEDRKKFKAVEKACNLLLKSSIDFYLFPVLPSMTDNKKTTAWMWNSLTKSLKFNGKGNLSKESEGVLNRLVGSTITSIFFSFLPFFAQNEIRSAEDFENFKQLVISSVRNEAEYMEAKND